MTWVGDRIATANEGDYDGGSRGFTIFNLDGSVFYDSGNEFEHLAARFGADWQAYAARVRRWI